MKLSKSFSLRELTRSNTAEELGISNQPETEHLIALTALSNCVLQPIRDHYGRAVIISSGYRSTSLNREIGGSSTSQHSKGEAADFTVRGVSVREVCKWIATESGLDFDQLIWERRYDNEGSVAAEWVHLSYVREGGNRKQVLTAYVRPSGTEYVAGLR